jgi:hypothetical protein
MKKEHTEISPNGENMLKTSFHDNKDCLMHHFQMRWRRQRRKRWRMWGEKNSHAHVIDCNKWAFWVYRWYFVDRNLSSRVFIKLKLLKMLAFYFPKKKTLNRSSSIEEDENQRNENKFSLHFMSIILWSKKEQGEIKYNLRSQIAQFVREAIVREFSFRASSGLCA